MTQLQEVENWSKPAATSTTTETVSATATTAGASATWERATPPPPPPLATPTGHPEGPPVARVAVARTTRQAPRGGGSRTRRSLTRATCGRGGEVLMLERLRVMMIMIISCHAV